jgi:DNA polymerase-3 subunit chi
LSRVDFYILPDVDRDARLRFACRLAYKAWSQGSAVRVRVDDARAAAELDELMWAYPSEHFLPHARTDDPAATSTPVLIATDDALPDGAPDGLLINLSSSIPRVASRFARVAEIIAAPDREVGRTRYRTYRHEGHPLYHHQLEDWEA